MEKVAPVYCDGRCVHTQSERIQINKKHTTSYPFPDADGCETLSVRLFPIRTGKRFNGPILLVAHLLHLFFDVNLKISISILLEIYGFLNFNLWRWMTVSKYFLHYFHQ